MSQTILVVEDDKDINEVVSEYMKDAGYIVISCGSAAQSALYQNEAIDLLLIDTQMDSVTIQTESVLLYRALANLIGNAVMYTPKNGVIHIALSANQLDIENECSHIPEEELQKLFQLSWCLHIDKIHQNDNYGNKF